MRTVDRRLPLLENDLVFVWTEHAAGSEYCLPAVRHTSGGRKDVVPAIPLVELRPFDRRMMFVAIEDEGSVVDDATAIGAHSVDREHAVESRSALCPGVNEIQRA